MTCLYSYCLHIQRMYPLILHFDVKCEHPNTFDPNPTVQAWLREKGQQSKACKINTCINFLAVVFDGFLFPVAQNILQWSKNHKSLPLDVWKSWKFPTLWEVIKIIKRKRENRTFVVHMLSNIIFHQRIWSWPTSIHFVLKS